MITNKQKKRVSPSINLSRLNRKQSEEQSYEQLVAWKIEQDRLIAEGKIDKPKRVIREFTSEERLEFENGITVEQLFKRLDKKYSICNEEYSL